VLPDEQLGGLVVKLFTGLLADLHARRLAARADLIGLWHIVLDALAAEVIGQRASTVPLLLGPRGCRLSRRNIWLRRSGFGSGDFVEEFKQAGLIGTELLALRTVESAEQLIEAMANAVQFAITRAKQIEQFADHPFQSVEVVGQRCVERDRCWEWLLIRSCWCWSGRRCRGGGRSDQVGSIRAHAIMTHELDESFAKNAESRRFFANFFLRVWIDDNSLSLRGAWRP
jgi:hypothetical protein